MKGIIRWVFWASLTCGVPLFAQTGTAASAAVPRQPTPFSATFKTTTVRTLADGATITLVITETTARDSAGRWMMSNTRRPQGSEGREFTSGNVRDPVAGTQTSWNSISHSARVIQLPPADQRRGCWANDDGSLISNYGGYRPTVAATPAGTAAKSSASGGGGSGSAGSIAVTSVMRGQRFPTTREDLGTSTIMGVEVHGTRITTTTPAGKLGNDRPLVHSNEFWVAPSLGITLRSITDDPRSGKITREVQALDLGEPPISMFQPPEDYKVVNEQLHQVDCPSQR